MSITLEKISKAFGEQQVLRGVSMTLPQRGRVCFFGPSGCGKSTLLRIICGLEKADAGQISMPKGLRFACQFQEDRLLPWYTVKENLALTMPEDQIQRWLDAVGLPEVAPMYPDELSGGMRRRVSLVRALGNDSDVLVLDEPLRELDESTAERLLKLVRDSIGDRLLLLVTHDRRQAEYLECTIKEFPL